ncbi:hypothetical protein KJ682_10085 [bacterium]|nr:hypothetical protein [bacterium]
MDVVNRGVTAVYDLLLGPLGGHPAWAMTLVAVVSAVWALLLFKAATPQDRLGKARDRLFGHIYEMGMYQDHLRVLGRIQKDLAVANLRYLAFTLPALLVLAVPMVLTIAQLEGRFAHRPLQAGESAVLAVDLVGDGPASEGVTLTVPEGVTVEAGPVHDRLTGSVAWRLRADAEGSFPLAVIQGGRKVAEPELIAGGGLPLLGHKAGRGLMNAVLWPGARSLPGSGPVAGWTLQLPERATAYLGLEMNWLVAFMVLSLGAGLALKDALRVSL